MAIVLHTNIDPSQLPLATDDGTTDASGNAVVNTPASNVALATPQTTTQVGAANDSISTASVPAGAAGTAKAGSYTTSDPFLPNPSGTQAPISQTAAVVGNTTMFHSSSAAPISEAAMFDILQKSAQEGYQLASTLNRAANMTKVSANKAAAQDLQTQVAGEREHAKIAFGTAIAAAGANLGVGYKGSQWQKAGEEAVQKMTVKATDQAVQSATNNVTKPGAATLVTQQKKADDVVKTAADNQTKVQTQDAAPSLFAKKESIAKKHGVSQNANSNPDPNAVDPNVVPASTASNLSTRDLTHGTDGDKTATTSLLDRSSQGAAMAQAGASVGSVIQAGGDYYDKLSGGQYQADQAKIAGKIDDLNAQIAQITLDSSKSTQDQALEALKAAQQAVQSYSQRWTEVNNNIANR